MIGALAAALLVPTVAIASPADLGDRFREAADAEVTARQVVVCWTGSGPSAAVFTVTQHAGMAMAEEEEVSTMAGRGAYVKEGPGEAVHVRVAGSAPWRLASRYEVGEDAGVMVMGRPARSLDVLEEGRVRVRFVFDDATGVPLTTEVFDGDGRLYRFAAIVDLQPARPESARSMESSEQSPADLMMPAEPAALPAATGGYDRVNSYAAPAGGVQAFYTDGLFSFSVFEMDRSVKPGRMDEAENVEFDGRAGYRLRTMPGNTWVTWSTRDRVYVLVGDLPPDHLEEVVGGLPPPGKPNVAVRLWRWLFG